MKKSTRPWISQENFRFSKKTQKKNRTLGLTVQTRSKTSILDSEHCMHCKIRFLGIRTTFHYISCAPEGQSLPSRRNNDHFGSYFLRARERGRKLCASRSQVLRSNASLSPSSWPTWTNKYTSLPFMKDCIIASYIYILITSHNSLSFI